MLTISFYWWLWMVSGVIGSMIGKSHGRSGAGFFYGFTSGPIGWIFILCDLSLKTFFASVGIFYFAVSYIVGILFVWAISTDPVFLKDVQKSLPGAFALQETENANPPKRTSTPEPTPAPTPQQFFPQIRLATGQVFRNVTVQRVDADGFVLNTNGNAIKVYNGDLSPEVYQAFDAASR